MRDELTIDSVRRDFEKWREVRVSPHRFPEDLVRAAAILAERTSVALVAKQLNINHTKLSRAVFLLRNERLPLFPSSSSPGGVETVPLEKKLTFTRAMPPPEEMSSPTPSEHLRSCGSKIHAQFHFPGGSSCDVTSLGAFRILCETILKGTF